MQSMHGRLGVTFIMVTHDLDEAFRLGSLTVIMNGGKIRQYDTPVNIRKNPADDWVRAFITV